MKNVQVRTDKFLDALVPMGFVFCLLLCGQAFGALTTPVGLNGPQNHVMSIGNPNLDPNWEWWNYEQDEIVWLYWKGANDQPFETFTEMPWFDMSGTPVADLFMNTPHDIWPEDGWELLFRDFGTPDEPAEGLPHFMLYNKYRGLIRWFVYNPTTLTLNYVRAELSFQSQVPDADRTSILSFSIDGKGTITDKGKPQIVEFVGKIHGNSWTYADFPVVAYDPAVPDRSVLEFAWHAGNSSNITIDGTALPIKEENSIGTGDADETPGPLEWLTINRLKKGYSQYRSLENWEQSIQDIIDEPYPPGFIGPPDPNHNDDWYVPFLQGVLDLGLGPVVPIIGGLGSIFSSLIFGKDAKSTPVLVNRGFNIAATGTIDTEHNPNQFYLLLPGREHSAGSNGVTPLYNGKLGLLSLEDQPTADQSLVNSYMSHFAESNVYPYGGCPWGIEWSTRTGSTKTRLTNNINAVLNPDSGLEIVDVGVAYHHPHDTARPFSTGGGLNFSHAPSPDFWAPPEVLQNHVYATGARLSTLTEHERACGGWGQTSEHNVYRILRPTQIIVVVNLRAIGSEKEYSYMKRFDLEITNTLPTGSVISNTPLILTVLETGNRDYASTESITLQGQAGVSAGDSHTYWSEKTISLQHGFHADRGSSFRAFVGVGSAMTSTASVLTSTRDKYKKTAGIAAINHNRHQEACGSDMNELSKTFVIEEVEDSELPLAPGVQAVYPNPFNPTVNIDYSLSKQGKISINVYNLNGELIRKLIDEDVGPGFHTVSWDGCDKKGNKTSSGVYLYVLESQEIRETGKLMLLK